MAAPYDLELVQGQTYERTFRWKVDGAPQPLTGYTATAQARAKEDKNSALLVDLTQYLTRESTGDAGAGIVDRLRLRVPATATLALTPKAFKATASWDLRLVNDNDPTDAFFLAEGAASLNASTTA
jgi:hypothetical protein